MYIHCYLSNTQHKTKLQRKCAATKRHRIQKRFEQLSESCYVTLLAWLGPSRKKRKGYRVTNCRHSHGTRTVRSICCMLFVLSATTTTPTVAQRTRFDTDSKLIYVDSGATASVTNDLNDCTTTPVPIRRKVNGIGGLFMSQIYLTTIKWDIEDDDCARHCLSLPKSFYIPGAKTKVMSPQHWCQHSKDTRPMPRGTWCAIYDTCMELQWNQRRYKRTLPFNTRGSNVAEMYTAPDYQQFNAFCAQAGQQDGDEDQIVILPAHIIEEDEEDLGDPSTAFENEPTEDYFPTRNTPINTSFSLDGPVEGATIITDEEDRTQPTDTALLLRYHHRTGHIPMSKLQEMAKQGMIPTRLSKCHIPLCTACAYGKATRKPWRVKGKQTRTRVVTRPGQCVSVDQLIPPTPGYIAQLRGTPTRKRYQAATIFVDQYSGAGFVHCQKTTTADETIEGKERFEAWAATHGITVSHYHADNGIFADNKFRKAVNTSKQTLSFCGVNAHFQNGLAERRIRELQGSARTMLIHANRRWSSAIDAHLWPYAIRYASDMFNHSPMKKFNGQSPMERLSGSKVLFNIRHAHTFGCPTYVLDNRLQQEKSISKWMERSRVGIFLGY
jgi:hypothetical protein